VSGEAVHGAGCNSKAERTTSEHLVLQGAASSSRIYLSATQTRT
jgi:hypothetical protein